MPKNDTIILYGHKLNGNLKAFYDYGDGLVQNSSILDFEFLTMDPLYYKELQRQAGLSDRVLYLGRLRDVIKVVRSKAIITDHGMHTLIIISKLTNIPFIDVWHGIPYKGFTPENFEFLRSYAEIWTSSPKLKELYAKKYKLDSDKIYSTGYARVDPLVNRSLNKATIMKDNNISNDFKKYVLVAPTWQQDDRGRSIVPFGLSVKTFFNTLNQVGVRTNTLIIFRSHLNANDKIKINKLSNVILRPYSSNPVAEDYLYIADVLVTDWSSIAFDYLSLDRPALFLDVPAPFKNGFSVSPKHRFGEIIPSIESLDKNLEKALNDPDLFYKKHKNNYTNTKKYAYGKTLDGKSAERYYARLLSVINKK